MQCGYNSAVGNGHLAVASFSQFGSRDHRRLLATLHQETSMRLVALEVSRGWPM